MTPGGGRGGKIVVTLVSLALAAAAGTGAWRFKDEGGQLFWLLTAGAAFLALLPLAVWFERPPKPEPVAQTRFVHHGCLMAAGLLMALLILLAIGQALMTLFGRG